MFPSGRPKIAERELLPVKFKKLHDKAITPVYASAGAACFDLHALGADWSKATQDAGKTVNSRRATIFRTGLSFEIPDGWCMLIFSRSGHGFKHNVRLSNCVGVIDSDYRGEVQVSLLADTGETLEVRHGDRIAQAMLVPVTAIELTEVNQLSDTERGTGGFGSTGA